MFMDWPLWATFGPAICNCWYNLHLWSLIESLQSRFCTHTQLGWGAFSCNVVMLGPGVYPYMYNWQMYLFHIMYNARAYARCSCLCLSWHSFMRSWSRGCQCRWVLYTWDLLMQHRELHANQYITIATWDTRSFDDAKQPKLLVATLRYYSFAGVLHFTILWCWVCVSSWFIVHGIQCNW